MKHTENIVFASVEKRLDTTNIHLLFILILMVIGLGLLEGDKLFATAGLQSMGFQLPELGFLALAVIPLSIFVNKTPLGKSIAMIGSNERAVHYSGINTRLSLVWVYLISGLFAGIAGIIMMARFDSANAAYGESYLLVAILAAVLGGVDPLGGFGRVSGVILSLLILQLVSTASILLDLSQFITLSLWGAILILASGAVVLKAWWAEQRKLRTRVPASVRKA